MGAGQLRLWLLVAQLVQTLKSISNANRALAFCFFIGFSFLALGLHLLPLVFQFGGKFPRFVLRPAEEPHQYGKSTDDKKVKHVRLSVLQC